MKKIIICCFYLSILIPFIAKSQTALQLEWIKRLDLVSSRCYLASIDEHDDKFVMVGNITPSDSTVGCSAADNAVSPWMLLTDLNGNKIWSRCYPGGDSDELYKASFGANNSIWVAGWFTAIEGEFPNPLYPYRMMIAKLDSTGNPFWYNFYGTGDTAGDEFLDFTTTTDGGALLCMNFTYPGGEIPFKYNNDPFTNNSWLCKVDSTGAIQWSLVMGGTGDNENGRVKELVPGIYTVLINTTSTDSMLAGINFDDSDYSPWLLSIDTGGHILSSRVVSGTGYARYTDFVNAADGSLLLAGTEQPANLGYCYPGLGEDDFTLIRADTGCNKEWCKINGGSYDDYLGYTINLNDSVAAIGGTSYSINDDLAHCSAFYTYYQHAWFSLVNINTQQTLAEQALCGSGEEVFNGFVYDSINQVLYVLVDGSSTDGDFTGVAVNDSGNSYLLKYALLATGINAISADTALFKIYPNPTTDYTTLSTDVGLIAAQLQIYNITGQLIFTTQLIAPTMQIATTNFAPGIYFIKLCDAQGQVGVGKLVKE